MEAYRVVRPIDALSEVERDAIAGTLRRQRDRERSGVYPASNITRGVHKGAVQDGVGYNEVHGVEFQPILRELLRGKDGKVRLLDMGCGVGYFLDTMVKYADYLGEKDRFEPHGVTMTRSFLAGTPESSELKRYKPLLGDDVIHVGHGERIRFPDNHFDITVSTFGPFYYYIGANAQDHKLRFLQEAWRVNAPGGPIYIAHKKPNAELLEMDQEVFQDFRWAHPQATVDVETTKRYFRARIVKNGL
jgi:SAM-dependent methyltransferase